MGPLRIITLVTKMGQSANSIPGFQTPPAHMGAQLHGFASNQSLIKSQKGEVLGAQRDLLGVPRVRQWWIATRDGNKL